MAQEGRLPGMTQPRTHELAERMAELARLSAPPRTVDEVLKDVTETARELMSGADSVGVLMIGRAGKFESLAGTSELPHTLDEIQTDRWAFNNKLKDVVGANLNGYGVQILQIQITELAPTQSIAFNGHAALGNYALWSGF